MTVPPNRDGATRLELAASRFVYTLIGSDEEWNVSPALEEWLELQNALTEAENEPL